jgi:hypothetical protein
MRARPEIRRTGFHDGSARRAGGFDSFTANATRKAAASATFPARRDNPRFSHEAVVTRSVCPRSIV